jgi:4'-phosphopantetheinyl transferase EntD
LAVPLQNARPSLLLARILAREALRMLGAPSVSLVPNVNRAPTWPPGLVRSISHTNDFCAVVVGQAPPLRSIGLDVGNLRVLDRSIVEFILTSREQSWLRTQHSESYNKLVQLTFSCKEAYYKCQYPVKKTFLDFHDVELDLDLERGRFEAQVLKAGSPVGLELIPGIFLLNQIRYLPASNCLYEEPSRIIVF